MSDGLGLIDDLDIDIPELDGPASAEHGSQFFGPYQLIQEVGQGGVARVMRARHIHPNYAETTFAIKILHENLSRDPRVVDLFRREAYVLSMLKHPNIVQTFEAGLQDEKLFIAMEYVNGRDLENLLSRIKRARLDIPVSIYIYFIAEILKALIYAHSLSDGDGKALGLLHRDINPANVFLGYNGRVKLGDFGVASIAAGAVEEQRELAGKMGYFAPEQLAGKDVDQRADIFAVGVLMFEMLTGERLFEADTADKMMRLNMKAKIPKPTKLNAQIDSDLEQVILTALDRKPQNRFLDAREMLQALGPHLPKEKHMNLAVASLVRKLFLKEHIEELQLQEGLAGASAVRGSGQLIGVVSTDDKAQSAFRELLLSRGYQAEVFSTVSEAAAATQDGRVELQGLLLDVSTQDFDFATSSAAMRRFPRAPHVIAVADGMKPGWVEFGAQLGAADYIFKPFNIERVLAAVRGAVTGASTVAPAIEFNVDERVTQTLKDSGILVLSRSPQLIVKLSNQLNDAGLSVETSPMTDEAVYRFSQSSYHVVIIDGNDGDPSCLDAVVKLRNAPGVALLPILFVGGPALEQALKTRTVERSLLVSELVGEAELIEKLNWLRREQHTARIFNRFPASFNLELRYGGRMFAGQAIDVSRGGMMLLCEQMPPVNTEVSVSGIIPGNSDAIEMQGRVTRVDMGSGSGHNQAKIGVEFSHFSSGSESRYIQYLSSLVPQ